jgi:hypothetical protein
MICVVVAGQATNIGSVDVGDVMSAVASMQAAVSAVEAKPIMNARAYITETWSRGTSWYRRYSDGWIEQGGYVSPGGNSAAFHIGTFNTAFSTTNITLVATNAYRANNDHSYYGQIGAFVASKTQFKETCFSSEKSPFHWFACGY